MAHGAGRRGQGAGGRGQGAEGIAHGAEGKERSAEGRRAEGIAVHRLRRLAQMVGQRAWSRGRRDGETMRERGIIPQGFDLSAGTG
jgi:hypothetical protein